MTNVDNSDTTYTNTNNMNKYNVRDMLSEHISTPLVVFRVFSS